MEANDSKGSLAVGVELIQDISGLSKPLEGFLRRYRHRAKTLLSDGTRTDVYVADFIDRDPSQRDAVVVGLFSHARGQPPRSALVLVRRQMRYAVYLATGAPLFTEVVAGLIESPELPEEAAVREVLEETGIEVDRGAVAALGPAFFAVPGTLTERMVPMAARVSESALRAAAGPAPRGDGPMEEGAEHLVMTLGEALSAMNPDPRAPPAFPITDAKTEIVFRRLEAALAEGRL